MRLHRILAITRRHWWMIMRDYEWWVHIFYWPLLDIMLWGYFAQSNCVNTPTTCNTTLYALVAGAIFWNMVTRANYGISIQLIEEVEGHNFINLFVTPLTLSEWFAGVVLLSSAIATVLYIFCMGVVYPLYGVNLFAWGWVLIPFGVALFCAGLWIGLCASILILLWGRRMQSLAYMFGYLFAPLSGIFYPITVLPLWAQKIAYALPMVHVFDALRIYVETGTIAIDLLIKTVVLGIFYGAIALSCCILAFRYTHRRGLVRLYE